MARKVQIVLELDDKGMAKRVQVDRKAVVDLDKAIDKTTKTSKRFGAVTSVAFGTLAAAGIQGALRGISNLARKGFRVLNDSVRLAGIQQIAERKLQQALKNLGDVSETSFKKLTKMASAVQAVSNFGDESIITAQAMLLSFKEVGAEGAAVLTQDMVDMAAGVAKATGATVDLNSVAQAIGKVFSDGSGALKRYGIALTDAEAAQLDALSGMEKVNALSAVLKNNFEGLAAATVDPFVQLGNSVGDLKEAIGSELRPELTALADDLKAFVEDPETLAFVKSVGQAFISTVKGASVLISKFQGMSNTLISVWRRIIGVARTVEKVYTDILIAINEAGQKVAKFFGNEEEVVRLQEFNRELQIRSLVLQAVAKSEFELAQALLDRGKAQDEADAGFGGGGAGAGTGGTFPSGTPSPGPGAGPPEPPEDRLALLKAQRDALVKEGALTKELIRLNQEILALELERQLLKGAVAPQIAEAAALELATNQELMTSAMQRTFVELEAAQLRIDAAREEAAIKAQLAAEQKKNQQQAIEGSIRAVLQGQSAADAIKNQIKGIIVAELAQAIAKSLGSLGPAALIVGPLVAGAMKALFSALVPGFATGGTIVGPPGQDNVLTRLTPGEEVINARAASENRPLLKRINSGVPLSAGMGPLELALTINGQLSATTEQISARLDETKASITSTRGQIRTREATS